jgi:hypothetical protein
MSKVIICTKFTGKIHLMPFFPALTKIIIRLLIITIFLGFIIILPTLTIIIMSFLIIPAWFLATIWVG